MSQTLQMIAVLHRFNRKTFKIITCRFFTHYRETFFFSLFIIYFSSQTLYAGHEHHKVPTRKDFSITYPDITISNVKMVNTENKSTDLIKELDKGPVIVNFIFTSCTAICPILSSTFSQIQKRFDEIHISNLNLVSFSIDPERDTPARLKEYANKFSAGSRWNFFTGNKTDMLRIEKIFGNYRGNKMNHLPYTFIRINKNSQWVRLTGFVSASVIIKETNKAISK